MASWYAQTNTELYKKKIMLRYLPTPHGSRYPTVSFLIDTRAQFAISREKSIDVVEV